MERKVQTTRKKVEYDPKKSYEWNPDDKFQLTGLEIDRIQKALTAAASSTEFQRHAVLYEGLITFNAFFRSAVEDGSITEVQNNKEGAAKLAEKVPDEEQKTPAVPEVEPE